METFIPSAPSPAGFAAPASGLGSPRRPRGRLRFRFRPVPADPDEQLRGAGDREAGNPRTRRPKGRERMRRRTTPPPAARRRSPRRAWRRPPCSSPNRRWSRRRRFRARRERLLPGGLSGRIPVPLAAAVPPARREPPTGAELPVAAERRGAPTDRAIRGGAARRPSGRRTGRRFRFRCSGRRARRVQAATRPLPAIRPAVKTADPVPSAADPVSVAAKDVPAATASRPEGFPAELERVHAPKRNSARSRIEPAADAPRRAEAPAAPVAPDGKPSLASKRGIRRPSRPPCRGSRPAPTRRRKR